MIGIHVPTLGFLSRYIIIPGAGRLKVIAFSDGGYRQGTGIYQISWVAAVGCSIAGDGFFIEEKAGGFFTCFHNGICFWVITRLNLSGSKRIKNYIIPRLLTKIPIGGFLLFVGMCCIYIWFIFPK